MTPTNKARMHERQIDLLINGRSSAVPGSMKSRKARAVLAQAKAAEAWVAALVYLLS